MIRNNSQIFPGTTIIGDKRTISQLEKDVVAFSETFVRSFQDKKYSFDLLDFVNKRYSLLKISDSTGKGIAVIKYNYVNNQIKVVNGILGKTSEDYISYLKGNLGSDCFCN
ncbi:MAG: hypothetical protein U9Q99_02775 [Nanoarchaeota archaeon]|nr:hypothetical protein [Nanoarchaeota archaeon]